MDRAISRHPVLVTPRIEFSPQYIPELPTITPRTDFGSLPDPCLVDDADDIDLAVDSDVEMMDPPLIDSDESEGELGPEAEKIPKPAGEAGRPASGGYNLETALGWKEVTFNKITKYVHMQASKDLNIANSYSKQKPDLLKQICVRTAQNFPIVHKYVADWPVRDMLKLHLKYTSERARLTKQKVVARKMKKVLRSDSSENECA